jgi:nucleotide-binding universal stress UspA family protein
MLGVVNAPGETEAPASVAFRHVLLPLDGSPLALAALPTARALTTRFGARLTTISVAADERDAQRLRRAALEALGDDPRTGAVEVVVAPNPAEVISRRREELGSTIVCMSTHGRGRVHGALIGSVARSVLLSSKAPVVAVGPHADRPGSLVGRPRHRPSNWPEPLSVGAIVACVDGSSASETVLPVAAGWAAVLDSALTILTVAEEASTDARGNRPNRLGPPDPQKHVDELARRWRDAVPSITADVVYDPIGVASGFRSYVATHPVGLVALTTNARSGFERIRLGATAAEIVRTSTAPALVVPLSDQ